MSKTARTKVKLLLGAEH